MIKIAVYGKGGIGKSTTVSNLSVAFSRMGLNVMQIGCDPKADSTANLLNGKKINTVLSIIKEKGKNCSLDELVFRGDEGVYCVEAGGPTPGMGCAGRGIIAALETLTEKNAFEELKIDAVIYDVLGDVVCGGFAMPIRDGYAEKVFMVTSGENMALHAAANIAMAVQNFRNRGYAEIGGLILNRRNVPDERKKVLELADDFETSIAGEIDFSEDIQKAESEGKTVLVFSPECEASKQYISLAQKIISIASSEK